MIEEVGSGGCSAAGYPRGVYGAPKTRPLVPQTAPSTATPKDARLIGIGATDLLEGAMLLLTRVLLSHAHAEDEDDAEER